MRPRFPRHGSQCGRRARTFLALGVGLVAAAAVAMTIGTRRSQHFTATTAPATAPKADSYRAAPKGAQFLTPTPMLPSEPVATVPQPQRSEGSERPAKAQTVATGEPESSARAKAARNRIGRPLGRHNGRPGGLLDPASTSQQVIGNETSATTSAQPLLPIAGGGREHDQDYL
jgi:hypothetical protein